MSFLDDPFVRSNELLLERLRVAVRRHVSASIAESLELRSWQELVLDGLVLELRGYVLAERLPPVSETASTVVNYPTPATWWDHWKQAHASRWWCRWFVHRFPPIIEARARTVELTVDLQRYRSYPEATVVFPRLGGPVRIHTLTDHWRDRPN